MTIVLQVLLFLLKLIGIMLLVILGLLLLAVVLVLLAPVRYKAKVKVAPEDGVRISDETGNDTEDEETGTSVSADGLISWLNPFLRVKISFLEKKLRYTVRIFGICILNSEKPKKEKKKKPKKEKKAKEKKAEKKKESLDEPTVAVEAESAETQTAESEEGQASGDEASKPAKKKESVFRKIKNFFEKIKAIPEKIKEKIEHIRKTLRLLWHKKEKVGQFLADELHKTAIGKAWSIVKLVVRHVVPGKVKGQIEFGTGDPESTGKALAVLGILYAAYGKGLTVVPDFYEKRLVADVFLKGRIRFGTLLVYGLRLIRDKHCKRFYKNFKKLLKVLKQKAE